MILLVTRVPDLDVLLLMLCSGREAEDESDRQRAWWCLMDRCISWSYKARPRATGKTPRTNRNKSRLRTAIYDVVLGRGTLIVRETFPRVKLSFRNDETVTFYTPTSFSYLYIRIYDQEHTTYECVLVLMLHMYIGVRLLLLCCRTRILLLLLSQLTIDIYGTYSTQRYVVATQLN